MVVLAHLSEVNNHPDLVKETLRNRLVPAILIRPDSKWPCRTNRPPSGTSTRQEVTMEPLPKAFLLPIDDSEDSLRPIRFLTSLYRSDLTSASPSTT